MTIINWILNDMTITSWILIVVIIFNLINIVLMILTNRNLKNTGIFLDRLKTKD